jgi:hypothetical protein
MKSKLENKEQLEEVIKNSININEVLNKLGYKQSGGLYKTFYKYVEKFNINISHFTINKQKINKKKLEDILTNKIIYNNSHNLKKRLYHVDLKQPICELCGQDEYWKGNKISLILDHINGNNKDNRLENLRIICPNCDAGLPTFKGKNRIKIFKTLKLPKTNLKLDIVTNIIEKNEIDFSKRGWGKKLGIILNTTGSSAIKYIQSNFNSFYKEKCYKYFYVPEDKMVESLPCKVHI